MDKSEFRKGLIAPFMVFVLGFGAFLRMPGSENVRAVQMLALLGSGMGLGVAIAHVRVLVGMGSRR
jgi:hypothetical protein